jgi:glycosyltransferase involved in cell wall biosynthesis
MEKKKKILFHSNCSRVLSGFGKNARNVLTYLHKTGKYELVELANGVNENAKALGLFPWKCRGTFPDDPKIEKGVEKDNKLKARAGYGHLTIEKIIEEEKPDVYIGAEDIWAFDTFCEKRWWNKLNTVLWVTIDSSPILESAINASKATDNFFCWSHFATKEMIERGATNTKTLHGPVDSKNFHKLKEEEREELRKEKGIEDEFIIGFVFRNQLRKSVPNLLDGFIKFKKENPTSKAKLLLHTDWSEGWDIPRLIKEKDMERTDILTTYFCKECGKYEVKPFQAETRKKGEKQDCPFCLSPKSQNTISVHKGPSEKQLNEIYNLMDVYCHPFTSGGQELPIQEAKLCELITLVTDYSCGQDCSSEDSGGMPLSWNEYREPGTQFIKASTCPHSIASKLARSFSMNKSKKKKMGEKARKFVLDNYSTKSVCEKLMKVIDGYAEVDWDYNMSTLRPDLNYKPDFSMTDETFVKDMYKKMLKLDISKAQDVYDYLLKKIREGTSKEKIYKALRDNAARELEDEKPKEHGIEDYLDNEGQENRLAIVLPESIGDVFLATSLLKDLKNTYPAHNIYFITKREYFEILEGNPFIHRVVPYTPICSDVLHLEGYSGREDRVDHEGYFDIAILLHVNNQRVLNYTRNGRDKISLELCT